MTPEIWAQIRRLSLLEKLTVSEIARRLVLDRKTVKRALAAENGPHRRSAVKKPSKLDPFKGYVQNRLKEFPRISAIRIFGELKRMGYPGGITILKDHLLALRPKAQEAFFRIETPPGEQAQVDWANCGTIKIGSASRKLSAFCMILSHCRMLYVELTLSQRLEDFLACHLRAFQFFGGIPKKILYDNLKSVCLARLGPDIRFNPKFMEFSGSCVFEPVLCRPARGNEKGKVENSIKYLRSSFLDGRQESSWSTLQADLVHWRDTIANVRIHATTRIRPCDAYLQEKPHLQALPHPLPDVAIPWPLKATSQSLVHFDGNAYSVPFTYAGKVLTLKATKEEIQVFCDAKLLAKHARSFERGIVTENPAHYEGLLASKKAAASAKLSDSFLALAHNSQQSKELLETYLKGLIAGELNFTHHLTQIIDLARLYGKTEVFEAITHALQFKAFGAPYLKNIILQQRAARGLHQAQELKIPSKPHWTAATVEEQDLSLYDDLFHEDSEDPQ